MSPFISVVVAFSVAWLMLALWVMKIGKRVNHLLRVDYERRAEGGGHAF